MSLPFYAPTNGVDPIISPMIVKFQEASPEFANKAIMPATYNTPRNPLFKVTDISILLGKKNVRQVLLEDQKKPVDDRFYTLDKDFTYGMARNKNGAKRRALFFTRRGFHIYLMTSRGDISNLFRNFLIVVLEELHEKGMVTHSNAVKITTEKYQDEIQKIENRLSNINLVLEREQNLRIEAEQCLQETEIDRDTLKIISEHHKRKVEIAIEYQENMTEDFPNAKEDELTILKEKYMKVVKLYVVPFEKVQRAVKKPRRSRKKKARGKIYEYLTVAQVKELGFEESDSEEEDEKDTPFVIEYDYSLFGKLHKPHPDDSMYYTLSPSKNISKRLGVYVDRVFISDKNHYDNLIKYLNTNCGTPLNGAFLTSINEIKDKLREIFISTNKVLLKI